MVFPGPAASGSASLGEKKKKEMQILGLDPRPVELETPAGEAQQTVLTSPPGDCNSCLSLRSVVLFF